MTDNSCISGTLQGSCPFAMYPSESRITGVIDCTAMRAASIAHSKQSLGDEAASTGTGDSPLRPSTAWNRSACSVFVGSPVEGPPRCTLTMTSGSSAITARPIASCLRATPGPEVVVTASAVGRADGCAAGGDLVLRLEGGKVEVLVARELVQDVRGGGDRVAAEEPGQPGEARCGEQSEGGGLVPAHVAIQARLEPRRAQAVPLDEQLGGLAEGEARLERLLVRLRQLGLLRESVAQVAHGGFRGPAVQPQHQAEGEHVPGAGDLLLRQAGSLQRHRGEA